MALGMNVVENAKMAVSVPATSQMKIMYAPMKSVAPARLSHAVCGLIGGDFSLTNHIVQARPAEKAPPAEQAEAGDDGP